jgi:hypothetical protein
MKENEIKSIVVRADGNEIKVDHAHELVIGDLTITPEMMESIMSISEYTFSEDIGDMIDTLIRLSYEDSLDDNETMNKIRTMSCVRDFLMDIEKSRPKD